MYRDRLHFFRSIHPISEEEYSAILEKLTTKYFLKGSYALSPGEVQTSLYFVKTGVQALNYEKGGKQHILAFTYYPNLCAVPDSLPLQTPTKYGYICLTDSEIEALPYSELIGLFAKYPNLETLFRKINDRLLRGVLDTYVGYRTLTIEERYKAFCQRSPHLLQKIPHKYIASYLGIDSTNFSKLYNSVRF
jgi:CRP-like cAMP-binding protein